MLGPSERLCRWAVSHLPLAQARPGDAKQDTRLCGCTVCCPPENNFCPPLAPCAYLVGQWIAELTDQQSGPLPGPQVSSLSAHPLPSFAVPTWILTTEQISPLCSSTLTVSLITALHLIGRKVHVHKDILPNILSSRAPELLAAYLTSFQRFRNVLHVLTNVEQPEKNPNDDDTPLSAIEWGAQVIDIPNICFQAFSVVHQHDPWMFLRWEAHAVRLVGAILSLWNDIVFPVTSSTGVAPRDVHIPRFLVTTTCQTLVRASQGFVAWFVHYCSSCGNTSLLETVDVEECSNVDLPVATNIPYIIAHLTRAVLLHDRAVRALARSLLSATAQCVKILEETPDTTSTYYPISSDFVFRILNFATDNQVSWISYPPLVLDILHAFMFADRPLSRNTLVQEPGPWISFWNILQTRHTTSSKSFDASFAVSPYQAALVVDALCVALANSFNPRTAPLRNTASNSFWSVWMTTEWPLLEQLHRLHAVWKHAMAPLLSDLPAYGYLAVAATRIRGVLLITDLLHHLSQEPDNNHPSFVRILRSMACTTPEFLHVISSELGSSIPARALSAYTLLIVAAGVTRIQEGQTAQASSITSEDDYKNMMTHVADPEIPPVKQWLTAILSPAVFSTLTSDPIECPHRKYFLVQTYTERYKAAVLAKDNVVVSASSVPDSTSVIPHIIASVPPEAQSRSHELPSAEPLDDDDAYFATCGPVQLAGSFSKSQTRRFLEVNTPSRLVVVNSQHRGLMPPTNLLTATVPTSLRQCLERLTRPLRPMDRGTAQNTPSPLNSNTPEEQRHEESPMETYWRIRRALVTIPQIAPNDFEGNDIAPQLMSTLLELQDPVQMDDFTTLQCAAAVALLVAWPSSAIGPVATVAFDVNIPFPARLASLEVLRQAITKLSNRETPSSGCHKNRFLPLAPVFLGHIVRRFEEFYRSSSKIREEFTTLQPASDISSTLMEERCLLFGDMLQTFTVIIEAAETSTSICTILAQIAYFFDIMLDSKHTHLRRSAMALLAKYPTVVQGWKEFQEALGQDRIPWITSLLYVAKTEDPDAPCREMAHLVLETIASLRQIS